VVWRYTIDREKLVNESWGWVAHCVPYRERQRDGTTGNDYAWTYYSGSNGLPLFNGFIPNHYRNEYLLDRNNGDRRSLPDNGGNATHWRRSMDIKANALLVGNSAFPLVRGPIVPGTWTNVNTGQLIQAATLPDTISEGTLVTTGATLVNRALPTIPASNVGQALTELYRDGIPRASLNALKSLRGLPRGAADDFLNYQFGWLPLASDVKRLVRVLREKNRIIEQLYRDSGRPVRRHRSLPPVVTTEVFPARGTAMQRPVGAPAASANTLQLMTTSPWTTCTKTTTTEFWFDGTFQYLLPLGDDTLSRWERYSLEADKLFGAALTPELLWEVAPWSWLVDWFTNTGDVISNATQMGQYGMVMRYGYVCAKVSTKYTFTGAVVPTGSLKFWGGFNDSAFTVEYMNHRFYRRRANPYGFGVTWESLSKTQLAILAALGMTRGNRSD
jgi:hypothetical protein